LAGQESTKEVAGWVNPQASQSEMWSSPYEKGLTGSCAKDQAKDFDPLLR